MSYPHQSIVINGRDALLSGIVDYSEVPQNDFETSTFDFIRRWLTGQEQFELQTSGSTGIPKLILVSREQMIASATLTIQALHLSPAYRALVCLDTRYVAGQMMLVRCFVAKMKINAVTPSANPFRNQQAIDFVALVPYQVYAILESDQKSWFDAITTVIVGGAPIETAAIEKLQAYSAAFYATYGMTETLSHVALRKLNGPDRSSYFKGLPGVKMAQDDRECLVLDVPYLPDGVVTNDIVEIIGHDMFLWLGRYDHVINSGGIKILPERVEEKVESVFSELHYPHRFFISGVPDEKLGEKVVLYVEGKIFSLQAQDFLSEMLRKALPAYALPRQVIVVETFETTQTSKINRLRTIQNNGKTLQKFTLKK